MSFEGIFWTCLWLMTDPKTWMILLGIIFLVWLLTPGRRRF